MPPVRGVYRNPGRWRAVIDQQEIRHSTAGCLLSVILFAPLFVRTYGVVSVATASLLYAGVIVPALAGYYSLPAVITLACCRLWRSRHDTSTSTRPSLHQGWILPAVHLLLHTATSLLLFLPLLLWTLLSRLSLHAILRSLTQVFYITFEVFFTCIVPGLLCVAVLVLLLPVLGVPLLLHASWKAAAAQGGRHGGGVPPSMTQCVTVNQAVLFVSAERLLLGGQVRVLGLSHLLMYSTASYVFVRYFGPPPPVVSPTRGGAPSYLAGTGWFMAGKMAKGAVVSAMLSLTGYQCLDGRHLLYTALTLLYYLITEHKGFTRSGEGRLITLIKKLHISALEEDEHFWLPVLMNILSVTISAIFLLPIVLPFQITWIRCIFTFLIGYYSAKTSFIISADFLSFTSLAASFQSSISGILSNILPSLTSSSFGGTPLRVSHLREGLSQGKDYSDLFNLWQGQSPPSVWWLLLAAVGIYTNVALPIYAVWQQYVEYQLERGGTIRRFGMASKKECLRQETCVVCLEDLTCGRITNCGHVYHAHCLRSLLNTNNMECPLCKRFL